MRKRMQGNGKGEEVITTEEERLVERLKSGESVEREQKRVRE